MSGGYFDYGEFRIDDIAESIWRVIYHDRYGTAPNYNEKTLAKLEEACLTLRKSAQMAHHIDWLLSGDIDEELFAKRWDEEIVKYFAEAKP